MHTFFISDAIEVLNKKLDMLKIHVLFLSMLHKSIFDLKKKKKILR